MKSIIFTLALVLIGQSWAQAKTIVISDMDDTIKISHVLDKSEAVKNMSKTGNVFTGMPDLYQLIQAENQDTSVYYVSNAPPMLMRENHTNFLRKNQFPLADDSLKMRSNPLNGNFKFETISDIIDNEKPTTVIMFGDNGEHDTEIYAQITKKYKNSSIRLLSYVHTVYYTKNSEDPGKVLEPGQTGFVTFWDLFLQLQKDGVVSDAKTELFTYAFAKFLSNEPNNLKDGMLIFPSWVDCRDFTWTAPTPDGSKFKDSAVAKAVPIVKDMILNRCNQPAVED